MAVPKLRFPEFTDDWEQRKLGDLYTERNERGNGSLQILSVSIHTGVSDGELDVDNLGKFVRRSEDKSTYKHVHSGDLIFNMMRAWQGAIGVAKTEGMISPAYISAIPSEDIYPPFMNYLLRRKDVINQINNLSYGVTDFRKRLYWNSFVQVNCKLPSVEEQRNITDVFEKIDHLITLHQRKLDDIKLLKKSMLQKMFPAEGRDVPEVRFPGFTAAWEQRKLGSISEIKTGPFGSTLHADDYVTDGIPIITTEHFKNGDLPTSKNGLPQVSDEDYKRLSSYVLNEGDIVFSRVGSVDINALVMPSQRHWLFSGRVLRVRPDMVNDPQFLHTVLETETIKADIRSRAVGQTMPSINTEILNETLVMMPQLRAEQEQIGQFFYSLNKTITLHQRKCDDLQKLKKALLQQMFC